MTRLSTLLVLIMFSATPAMSASKDFSYTCTTKARDHYMQPFDSVTGQFDSNSTRPLELRVKAFTTKVLLLRVDGRDQVGMWLGTDDYHSSVTMVNPGQTPIYLNTVTDGGFAVATCTLD